MSDVDVVVSVLKITDQAFLVTDGDREVWLPKSQIDCESDELEDIETGEDYTFNIPEWLALDKELI